MPKHSSLRSLIEVGRKAYILAATPPPAGIYRDLPLEGTGDTDPRHRQENRKALLEFGLTVKWTVLDFLEGLEADHGRRRSARLREWIDTGVVNAYSYRQRQTLYADRNRLERLMERRVGSPRRW